MDGHTTAPRFDRNHVTRLQAQGLQIVAAERGRSDGLQCIKHGCATRHATGVPMLQLAASDQHERILRIGSLVCRNDVGGHQVHAAVVGVEAVDEHRGRAGVVRAQARVGHAGFALQALPSDARDGGMHGLAHLLIDLGHAIAFSLVAISPWTHPSRQRPVQRRRRRAQTFCNLLDDPQVRFGLARWVNGLLAELHHAVGVADRTVLLGPGRGGQNHVGQPSGFGHKDVLHDHMLERRQRVAGMVQVGVTHGRVFAHDVHAMHLVRVAVVHQCLVHDFHHGIAGLVIQWHTPEILEPLMRGLVGYALVVGVHHGDESGITCPLHVILAAQRMQAGTGLADLTGHRDQCDQAACVIGSVHVLAHAHAPQNHGAASLGELPGHLANGLRGDATDRLHGLRAVALDVLAQSLKVTGSLGDEVLVGQALFDHDMDHRVKHGHIGVGLELQRAPRVFANVGDAGVGQHNLRTLLGCILHPGSGYGMVGRGVGANHKDQV